MIIKKLANIAFYFAASILLLHTLVPHFHEEGSISILQAPESEEEGNLIWLLEMIKKDLGEGHLEDFSVQDIPTLDNPGLQFDHLQALFAFFKKTFLTSPVFHSLEPKPPTAQYNPFPMDCYVHSSGLRAPPLNA